MPNKKPLFKKNLKIILSSLLIVTLLAVSVPFLLLFLSGKSIYDERATQVEELRAAHPEFFQAVFHTIFPQAIECHEQKRLDCAEEVRPLLETFYEEEAEKYPSYYSYEKARLKLIGNLPMYFIQLKGDTIAKLFLSGDVKLTPVQTHGERQVKDVLLGRKKKLYWLHGNDDVLRVTYLDDFLSEVEVIVPITENGEVVGAVVFLHGD